MFLNQQDVDKEEEDIRVSLRDYSDQSRKDLYALFNKKLKDPDTYAALNWSLFIGFHHLYLGKYWQAIFEWVLVAIGVFLLLNDFLIGASFIIVTALFELYQLFRSQVIVQDHNNKMMRRLMQASGY
jgi:TM2 domain-containing membrane protein YozV